MNKYDIDSAFLKYCRIKYPFSRPLYALINPCLKLCIPRTDDKLKIKKLSINGYYDKKIKIIIFEPKDIQDSCPCLVYFHGGGFLIQAAPYHYSLLMKYALGAKCKVIFADYHLTVNSSYPAPVEDCFSAYKWALENSDALNIDKHNIAVGGDSAGGNLAAAVSLMARDRLDIIPCFQMLIYPVIDPRMQTASMKKYTDTPMWNSKLSKKMWDFYLKGTSIKDAQYAAPILANSLLSLPQSYIEAAQYDCLHDEAIDYANALLKAGNSVELNTPERTVHGFDIALESDIVKKCVNARIDALNDAFYGK